MTEFDNNEEYDPFSFTGKNLPLIPAPDDFESDDKGKQRAAIRSAIALCLKDPEVRSILVWKQANGASVGKAEGDDIMCWINFVKKAPKQMTSVLIQGEFTIWERAKMLNHVLRQKYVFENGKMTGELLSVTYKSQEGSQAAA